MLSFTPSKPKPRILVLLAAYNGSQWIEEQIESILAQKDVRVQIVIRDDGSIDNTRSILHRFESDCRVNTTFATSGSGSAAQNFLELIRSNTSEGFEFIALSDQDDIWYPGKLSEACKQLRESGAAGYSSATLAVWEDGRSILLRPSAAANSSDFLLEGAGQGCTFVLTATLYERVRQYITGHRRLTESLHFHDWAIYALARAWNLQWAFDPAPSMAYRQHGSNDTGARGSAQAALRRLRLIKKGWYFEQLSSISALCSTAAPENGDIAAWTRALHAPRTLRRRMKLARLCMRAGRRRPLDNMILIAACIAGWI